jgi:aminotransferase
MELIAASGIRKFFDLLAGVEGVISLGVGEPDFVTPDRIRQAAIRSIDEGHTHYTSNFGLLELREAISEHLERLYGVRYDPLHEIIVTAGVSEGLNIAAQAVLDPGDEVLSPSPSYVAYQPSVTLAGGDFVSVPTSGDDGFQLHAEDLDAHVTPRSKALLIGYPANPTGAVLAREEAAQIAGVVERHDLAVISDEIYDRLVYGGAEHVCFPSLPGMRERTILLGGFSKAYAMTGWRLGYLCAPAELLEGVMRVHQYVMMSAPTVAQYAALEGLRHGEDDVQAMVAEYDARRRLIVEGFNQMGLRCIEPRGAFYVFPDITVTGLNDEAFAEQLLLEERVAVVPGSAFGDAGIGHIRACYATSLPQIEEALVRTARFINRHRHD